MNAKYEYKASSSAYVKTLIDSILRLILALIFGFGLTVLLKTHNAFYLTILAYIIFVILCFASTASRRLYIDDKGVWFKKGFMPWDGPIKGVEWSNLSSLEVLRKKTGNEVILHQKEGNTKLNINDIKDAEEASAVVEKKLAS